MKFYLVDNDEKQIDLIIKACADRNNLYDCIKRDMTGNILTGLTIIPKQIKSQESTLNQFKDKPSQKLERLFKDIHPHRLQAFVLFSNPDNPQEQVLKPIYITASKNVFDPVNQLFLQHRLNAKWIEALDTLSTSDNKTFVSTMDLRIVRNIDGDCLDEQRSMVNKFRVLRNLKGWSKIVYKGFYKLSISRVDNNLSYSLMFSALVSTDISCDVFHRYITKAWCKLTNVNNANSVIVVNTENQHLQPYFDGLQYLKTENNEWNISLLRKHLMKPPLSEIYHFENTKYL